MAIYYLFALLTFLFFMYFFAVRRIWAALFFLVYFGYLVLSYRYYFMGGWESSDIGHPFNEELIFSMLVLSLLATTLGLLTWIWDRRINPTSGMCAPKFRRFIAGYILYLVFAGILIIGVPLTFEMPVDLRRCDGSNSQPSYCQ